MGQTFWQIYFFFNGTRERMHTELSYIRNNIDENTIFTQ